MNTTIEGRSQVTVVDVQMPFVSMVVFILKWTLASIPAMILVFLIAFVIATAFGGVFASMAP